MVISMTARVGSFKLPVGPHPQVVAPTGASFAEAESGKISSFQESSLRYSSESEKISDSTGGWDGQQDRW